MTFDLVLCTSPQYSGAPIKRRTVVLRAQPLQLEPVLKHILMGLNTSCLTGKNQNMYKRVSRSGLLHIKHTGQDSMRQTVISLIIVRPFNILLHILVYILVYFYNSVQIRNLQKRVKNNVYKTKLIISTKAILYMLKFQNVSLSRSHKK